MEGRLGGGGEDSGEVLAISGLRNVCTETKEPELSCAGCLAWNGGYRVIQEHTQCMRCTWARNHYLNSRRSDKLDRLLVVHVLHMLEPFIFPELDQIAIQLSTAT